jgi:altered-inheritance-of-mitochondria protein 5
MGFTTGFVSITIGELKRIVLIVFLQTGGVTVTLGLAYLTVLYHERNRQSQALHLRSQSHVLNSLLEPEPTSVLSRAELARKSRSTFTESAKDRWNGEIENAVRFVHRTDWAAVREGMESAIARALGLGLEKSREGIEDAEKRAGPIVQEALDRSKAAASDGAHQAAVGLDRAAAATIHAVERAPEAARSGVERLAASTREGLSQANVKAQGLGSATKASVSRAAADAKAEADHAAASIRDAAGRGTEKSHEVLDRTRSELQSTGAGTADAARGAVRNAVSKGIEKGKEVLGKAQAAAGFAKEKIETASQSNSLGLATSDVEKALRERYEQPTGLNKTVEEVLEERYKPIDSRDNTVLRGV